MSYLEEIQLIRKPRRVVGIPTTLNIINENVGKEK